MERIKIFKELNEMDEDNEFDDDLEVFNEVIEEETFDEVIIGELLDFFNSLIDETVIKEEFSNRGKKQYHFRKHCIGRTDKKSTKTNVYYDFKELNEYLDYEKTINNLFAHPNVIITTLADKELVTKEMIKLFRGNYTVELSYTCGFKNNYSICIKSFSSDVTTNYSLNNTMDIFIRTMLNKTATLYPVDAYYFETKLNNIFSSAEINIDRLEFNDKTFR